MSFLFQNITVVWCSILIGRPICRLEVLWVRDLCWIIYFFFGSENSNFRLVIVVHPPINFVHLYPSSGLGFEPGACDCEWVDASLPQFLDKCFELSLEDCKISFHCSWISTGEKEVCTFKESEFSLEYRKLCEENKLAFWWYLLAFAMSVFVSVAVFNWVLYKDNTSEEKHARNQVKFALDPITHEIVSFKALRENFVNGHTGYKFFKPRNVESYLQWFINFWHFSIWKFCFAQKTNVQSLISQLLK